MITVYHGSHMEIQQPDVSFGRTNLDFGQGFYVTTLKKQAEKWAQRKAAFQDATPVINIYNFVTIDLNILSFDGYTEEWLDFVIKCRTRIIYTSDAVYDAVYGNIADDDVAATIDEYMRLLEMNRVNEDVKKATLYQLTFSKPNNQYCIISQKAADKLRFNYSYKLEN